MNGIINALKGLVHKAGGDPSKVVTDEVQTVINEVVQHLSSSITSLFTAHLVDVKDALKTDALHLETLLKEGLQKIEDAHKAAAEKPATAPETAPPAEGAAPQAGA